MRCYRNTIRYIANVYIKVSKTSMTVDEKNPEQEIILESTLPVPCRSPFPQDCKIRVEMKATNDPKGKPNVITGKLLSKGFLAVKLKPTKNQRSIGKSKSYWTEIIVPSDKERRQRHTYDIIRPYILLYKHDKEKMIFQTLIMK